MQWRNLLRRFGTLAKETGNEWLETARSTGLPRKIILVLLGVASCIIVVIPLHESVGIFI